MSASDPKRTLIADTSLWAAFAWTAMSRPITAIEAVVLEHALRAGPVTGLSPEAMDSVRDLRVTALCKCECATVWFGPEGGAACGVKAAEACGTWNGQTIAIIVWSTGGQIVGLEVVGAGTVGLPDPASVRPLEQWFQ